MRKFSMDNLREKDIKIVEKKKFLFLVPLAIIIIAIIMGIIFGFTTKSPFNLGMDFTGGYTITIRAGALINEENYDEYHDKVKKIVEDYRFDYENSEYAVNFESIQKLGAGNDTSLRIQYRADNSLPRGVRDDIMSDLNEGLVKELNNTVGYVVPASVSIANKTATVTYDKPILAQVDIDNTLKKTLAESGISVVGNINFVIDDANNPRYNKISFTFEGTYTEEDIRDAAMVDKYFSAKAISGDMISGTVSTDLIYSAILAVLIALILMLIYIFIRFELASGVAAVIALLHDIIMMFAFMTIFHVEITSTFIAALITILGYSINNTIIIFDRVRENRKAVLSANKSNTATEVANKSIKDTMARSIYTTMTTLIMIGMIAIVCAIGGVTDMVTFSLPIIFGLVAGAFSSICIAPSIWVLLKRNRLGELKQPRIKTDKADKRDSKSETNLELS